MLTAVCLDTGQKVYAAETAKNTTYRFSCPECRHLVSFKPGHVRIAHFAHQAGAQCTHQSGESEEHRRLKQSIYTHLKEQWGDSLSFIDMEYRLNARSRPDIFVRTVRGTRIAIEVQLSALSIAEIAQRTHNYFDAGVHVLWVIPYEQNRFLCRCQRTDEIVAKPKVRLKEQELFMYYAYFNRLLMWTEKPEPSFVVALMEDYWTEGADFYDSDQGTEVSYAPQRTKLTKAPTCLYQSVQFNELVPKKQKPFNVKQRGYQIPERLILTFDERNNTREYIGRVSYPPMYEEL